MKRSINFSLEVAPHTDLTFLPKVKDIYIIFRPGGNYLDLVRKAEELSSLGYNPVPHFPARSIKNLQDLRHFVKGVRDAGVKKVLIIGGDREVYGEFHCSMQLIETGLFDDFVIGIAGHPEGAPNMSDETIQDALLEKAPFVDYVVTQWAQDNEKIKHFVKNTPLPVHVGLAGPASLKTLVKYAKYIGLEHTFNFARKNISRVKDLLTVQTPDAKIEDLIFITKNFHIYAFGGLKKVNEWLQQNNYL